MLQVCEAKCIKCGKFGHMNTDKRCPLYGKAVDAEAPIQNIDQDRLIQEMRAEGLAMRWSAWDMNKGRGGDTGGGGVMQQMVEVERTKTGPGPAVDRAEVLKNMSKEEKKALLKKLEKMDKKKKKKAKKEKKKKSHSSDSDSDSDSERRSKKEKKRRSRSRDRQRDRSRSRSRDRRRERSRSRDDRKYSRRDSSEDRDRDRRDRRDRSRDRRDSRRS